MSLLLHRVRFIREIHFLLSTAIVISAGCYKAPSIAPQPKVIELQTRRFAGVDIVPINHSAFLIRINSGIIGNGEPLYVIDGSPMRIPANRGIDWFKPEDIAVIRVLKYPHELLEYGPNGVNGVIVITTKQGAPQRH